MTAYFVILHLLIDGVHVTGFTVKVSARLGQSPLFGPCHDVGWGSRSSARTSSKLVNSHTATSNNIRDFSLGMCCTLPQEDVEAGKEVGLNRYLAPTGGNHSFQGYLTQGLDLKPLSWKDAQARTAPGVQPSPSHFGDFVLVLSCASSVRDTAEKEKERVGGQGGVCSTAGLVLLHMQPSSAPGAR